jgi:hypothetical protein
MAVDRRQYTSLIARTLGHLQAAMGTHGAGICTQSAVHLLLGTMAVESDFGRYIRQRGGGPALGRWQIEPETFADIRRRWSIVVPELKSYEFSDLEHNDRRGIIVCRLKYRDAPPPLPEPYAWPTLAAYWKEFYNTRLGKGTPNDFLVKATEHLGPLVLGHKGD